ncbi:MAG TPA: hypothetical protein VIM62_11470 [Acidobacteriaceae bacterium]
MELNDQNRRDESRKDRIERDALELSEFESELRQAMQRKAAPLGLKQRVLAQARERRRAGHGRMWMLQRVAASAVLAAAVGGFAAYHEAEQRESARRAEEQRKGEEVRQQVLTALRITNKTLTRVSDKLADDDR